jgi:glycine cleavage system pyridoxal-binding protein P
MNLDRQPEHIKRLIEETIDDQTVNTGKFSHFHFVKFCGKFGLKQIAENSTQFASMLNTKIKSKEVESEEDKDAIIQF